MTEYFPLFLYNSILSDLISQSLDPYKTSKQM